MATVAMHEGTLRLIVASTKSGDREGCTFTEDMDTRAVDFVPGDLTVDVDVEIPGGTIPLGFPTDYWLQRTSI